MTSAPARSTPLAALRVLVAARQVRLSAAHHEMLFGANAPLDDVCPLPPSNAWASASVVDVRGAVGALKHVRVMGPLVKHTEVRLAARDALLIGLSINLDAGAGCALEGPKGTVVLAAGLRVGLRLLCLDKETARRAELVDGKTANVVVRGERERELRDVSVSVVEGQASWLEIDVDDANALEIGPAASASIRA